MRWIDGDSEARLEMQVSPPLFEAALVSGCPVG
jgi:hypothetical protein